MTFTAGSLFTGIGMIDYAFAQASFDIRWQVELNPFCRQVLAKHHDQYWPNAEVFEDVKRVGRAELCPVDVIFGGSPCQDISNAGQGAGIKKGTRSGLWFEYARIIGELRPRYVFIENVPPITTRGGTTVLAQLAEMGFDAEWGIIPASAAGAPHKRERWFCIAYLAHAQRAERGQGRAAGRRMADLDHGLQERQEDPGRAGVGGQTLANAQGVGLAQQSEVAGAQSAVGGSCPGTGSGAVGGDLAEGVRVGVRTAASGAADVQQDGQVAGPGVLDPRKSTLGNAAGPRLPQPRQPELASPEAQSRAGLVAQPERPGGPELADADGGRWLQAVASGQAGSAGSRVENLEHADGPSARHGHVGTQPLLADGAEEDEAVRTALPDSDDGNAERGFRRIFDGYPARLDAIRRQSRWPAPPGSPQGAWEPPRISRSRQPNRAKRLEAIGNSVVWQVVAPFAEAIWWSLEKERVDNGR